MNKLIPLTTNSWLLRSSLNQSGLLFKKPDGFLYLSTTKRLEFTDMDAFFKRFHISKIEPVSKEQPITTVNGFPTKHENIKITSLDPPLYTKNGNTVFVAGYWCLLFVHGWTLAFCPKQNTVQDNESSGPFKNRLEALNQINILNNKRNLEEQDVSTKHG